MQDMREADEGQSQKLLAVVEEKLTQELLDKYPERPRLTRIPYGYITQTDYVERYESINDKKGGDPDLLVPDPVVIPFLESALDQLDAGVSLRVVADWLNSSTPEGSIISHQGLKAIRLRQRPDFIRKTQQPKLRRLNKTEAMEKRRRNKIAQERKRLSAINKRVLKYEDEISIIKGNKEQEKDTSLLIELDYGSEEFKAIEDEVEIHFKPNPGPQTAFFAAEEQEVLYGGAAGGGKSYALIADPMRYFDNKNFRGLILRRTNDELRELIWKTQELYPNCIPNTSVRGNWREKDKEWRLPSGARLWMTYLEREEDVLRYQGQAFTYIGFDELTQHPTPFAWNYMRTRLRDSSRTLPVFMRATSNPGGPGHGWVKKMFIDPAPFGKAFDALNLDTGEKLIIQKDDMNFPVERRGKPLFQRRFIPAKLADNPYLDQDGQYRANLLSQHDDLQRQLLEGDWDVADGAAFSEFRSKVHTCEPYDIPKNWRRFRSCDFGYSTRQSSAVHWYAIHPSTGQLIVYRELYVNQLTGRQLAERILKLEEGENITYGVLDSSVWAVRGQSGPSIAEEMIHAGCRWRPSDRSQGSRIAGKNRLHELLRVDSFSKLPGIVFFSSCRQIISDLPVIPNDKDSDDIDPKYASDHAYDSIRYGIMTRPKSGYDDIGSIAKTHNFYTPASSTFGY